MISIGNFFFRFRNGLFPLVYLLLLIKGPAIFPDHRIAVALGFLVAFVGQAIRGLTVGLDYIIRGGRQRRVYADQLVQGGLFAHCRNPLYIGNLVIILGLGLASNSLLFLAIASPFFLFAYRAIIAAEENFLRGKFGDEFDAYCRRVPRFAFRLNGLSQTLTGMRFNWRRLISAEYGTAFAWFAVMTLVALHHLWMAGRYDWETPGVRMLWLALFAAMFAYSCARYLKKSGRLAAPPRPA